MRYMAIDLGDKRTGLAVGDDESGLVSPVAGLEIPLTQEKRLIDAIAHSADEFGVEAVVIGLPLNMDGSEGSRSELTRAFAQRLEAKLNTPIALHDERLTSADADWRMAQSGLTRARKKARRDALAASAILRDYLDSISNEHSDEET